MKSIPKPFVKYLNEMILGMDTNDILKFDKGYIRIVEEGRGTEWEAKIKSFKVEVDSIVKSGDPNILMSKRGLELKNKLQLLKTNVTSKTQDFLA